MTRSAFLHDLRSRLRSCLPPRWRARAAARHAPYRLVIDPDGRHAELWRRDQRLHRADLDALAGDAALQDLLRPHRHPLELVLPQGWVLRRRLALPRAARENLRQVVGYELDRLTPFAPEQLYYDVQEDAASGAGELLTVEVALVPRRRVAPWLEALQRIGVPLDHLVGADAPGFDLLPPERRPRPRPGRVALAALPGLLLLGLAGAALWLPLQQARDGLEGLRAEEARLRHEAGRVLALRDQLDQRLQTLDRIRQHWAAVPPPLEVLALLTRLLPDHTYLQQLEIKGTRLTLRGLSGQASALIGLLERSPAFENPHFLSPVTQQRGREVFRLEATIRLPLVEAMNPQEAPAHE